MAKEEMCDGCCYRRTCDKDLTKCCYLVGHHCIVYERQKPSFINCQK